MAAKKYKAKKSSTSKEAAAATLPRRYQWGPWSKFPPTNPSYHPTAHKLWMTNLSSAAGITKSWLPTAATTRCDAHQNQRPQPRRMAAILPRNPTPHPNNHYLRDSTTIVEAASQNPDASLQYWCVIRYAPARVDAPPTSRSYVLGPQLSLSGVSTGPGSSLMVRYTVSLARPLVHKVIGSDRSVTVVSHDVIRHHGVSVRHVCTTPDPFDPKKKPMEFTSLVSSQGNFYAMSLQGALAVMQVIDTRLTITAVGATRAVPSKRWRFFKEYLFEMKGEILLIFLIHEESHEIVDRVEVYRLDLVRVDWVRVERLRGNAVFLKETCTWVDSEEFGCRDDRVYFTEGSEKRWKVFNVKTCCISPVSSGWSWPSRYYNR